MRLLFALMMFLATSALAETVAIKVRAIFDPVSGTEAHDLFFGDGLIHFPRIALAPKRLRDQSSCGRAQSFLSDSRRNQSLLTLSRLPARSRVNGRTLKGSADDIECGQQSWVSTPGGCCVRLPPGEVVSRAYRPCHSYRQFRFPFSHTFVLVGNSVGSFGGRIPLVGCV
jgi:hypothetical protein